MQTRQFEQLKHDFSYHPPSTDAVRVRHESIRRILLNASTELAERMPSSREASLALTKLEEAMFWANAAIARHQADSTE